MEYKSTLNLPQTDFPIRANLKIVEEKLLSFWEKEGLSRKREERNAKLPKYILHDGPPYPNGDIHLGHALNKILKDIVVKFKSMSGFSSPYLPGWDCHGLPIETQLLKELGIKRQEMDIVEFRRHCHDYAMKYVEIQREEFKRLGVFGDWESPYLTLNPNYEEKIIELFGILAEKGYIYRGLKPIHWCPNCETALAEAEIEYEDRQSDSIYVKFPIVKTEGLSSELKILASTLKNSYFVIWTTTPWTLPANVAIALHPEYEYAVLKTGEETYVVALSLLENVAKKLKWKDYKILDKAKGMYFEGIVCRHPFIDRDVMVVLDKLVTLEEGTGCVHIAPGHGEEDWEVGLNYKLPMIMPVDNKGYFTEKAGKYAGIRVDDANEIIISDLKNSKALLYSEKVIHSYPHCWRCKKPVIFRATEQWFISVDKNDLRRQALQAIGNTRWFPGWGENRIRGMIESRPDWCISRQRSWGVPIPVFYCKSCGKPQMTGKFNEAIRLLVKREGTDSWFMKDPSSILPASVKCPDCGGTQFKKETDILDVWFESGASHFAVLRDNPNLRWPADLYLEGSDQHRGWFQTSLLLSVPVFSRAPYGAVLTHGFTVDEEGKKMSKSLGNVVDPQSVVKKYGADILRLWVASTDFRSDMSASERILKQNEEAFIKIRNTCRFMLGNIYDFNPEGDSVAYEKLAPLDKWALLKLAKLIERVRGAYEDFEFHAVFHSIYNFCVNDMSARYLDKIKDRLYCEGGNSEKRRMAQTVVYEILITLIRLFAPILSFTAEDIWQHMRNSSKGEISIFLLEFPKVNAKYLSKEAEEGLVSKIFDKPIGIFEYGSMPLLDGLNKALEGPRNEGLIQTGAAAELMIVSGDKKLISNLENNLDEILEACGISEFKPIFDEHIPRDTIVIKDIKKSTYKKCARCWRYEKTVGRDMKFKDLCGRCIKVIGGKSYAI